MATKWDLDFVHSNIDFTVRHLLVSKVRGRFGKWSAALQFDENDLPGSSVEVHIDAASIDTSEPQRDAHLRSGDFFQVDKFPTLTFKSSRVEKTGEDRYAITGDLTIRGVTRPVVLAVEHGGRVKDPWGKDRTGFTATATIDRKDFGVSWNQTLDKGGLAVSDKVAISIDVEATAAAAEVAVAA